MSDLSLPTDVVSTWQLIWPALVVALLRIADVTVNVFRTVFTVQGRRGLAAVTHAIEGALWLSAAGIVFADMTPVRAAGFVVGVGVGTWIGMAIVHRLRLGTVTVRVFVDVSEDPAAGERVLNRIHRAGFGATRFRGEGFRGPVDMVLSTVRRREAQEVMDLARQSDVDAFIAMDNEKFEAGRSVRV